MLQTRRGFVIGAGSLLTTAFVDEARCYIRRTGEPLLVSPADAAQTLYWYDFDAEVEGHLLSLGKWRDSPPPPPTWREFFTAESISYQTSQERDHIHDLHGIGPEDYDELVDQGWWWETRFGYDVDPCHKAYLLLSQIDLGPKLDSDRGPLLEFHGPGIPGGSSEWVTAKDTYLSCRHASLISKYRSESHNSSSVVQSVTPAMDAK